MEQTNWAPQHSEALRELVAKGLSYSEISDAINAKFHTCYSRNAAIGRAKRMGIANADRPKAPSRACQPQQDTVPERRLSEFRPSEFRWPMPVMERAEPVALRCVEVDPRHLSLLELERNNCRYPYGGDEEGEAITFCGHPRRKGSSYCTPHFHLTRDPGALTEPAVSAAPLRLVDAAKDVEKQDVREDGVNARGTNQAQEAASFRESTRPASAGPAAPRGSGGSRSR